MHTPLFTGACPALVTPFHESGGVDCNAFIKLIDYQIAAGVDAVCVCGTTGESSTLSDKERDEVMSLCVRQTGGRVPVIAGTGCNNTAVAAERAQRAQELGADALLIVTPYYNKATQAGLVQHYRTIAAHTDLPIILYNVPGRTGVSFTAETYQQLAENPQFIGVKEASGNLSLVTHAKALCPDDFCIWSGNDDQVVPIMALGGQGVISVACNIIPEIMIQMTHLCLSERYSSAARLQIEFASLIDALFAEVNPILIKSAMELLGMCSGHLRLPLCRPSPSHLSLLTDELNKRGLL